MPYLPLMLVFFCQAALAQTHAHWGALQPGPFPVGFQVIETYDRSRTRMPRVDFEGNMNEGELGWPMQIGIWYPADVEADVPRMPFADYAYLLERTPPYGELTEAEKQAGIERYKREVGLVMRRLNISNAPGDEDMERLLRMPTAAVKQARPKRGPFPVVLFSSNFVSSNQVLPEYLASHGYIVASNEYAPGVLARESTTWTSEETTARNLAFLRNQLRTFPSASAEKLALHGRR